MRLAGPAGNPDGIGAVLRLDFGGQFGPAREVQAGSGFWSQNSPVQVLALPSVAKAIEVRWPGGKKTRSDLPASAREVEVSVGGALRVIK